MSDDREKNAVADPAAVATPALGERLERAYARIDAAEFIAGDPVQFPRRGYSVLRWRGEGVRRSCLRAGGCWGRWAIRPTDT